jgi:hypothetical protein
MMLDALFPAMAAALAVALPVVGHLRSVEHRLTRLETIIAERLPAKP